MHVKGPLRHASAYHHSNSLGAFEVQFDADLAACTCAVKSTTGVVIHSMDTVAESSVSLGELFPAVTEAIWRNLLSKLVEVRVSQQYRFSATKVSGVVNISDVGTHRVPVCFGPFAFLSPRFFVFGILF